MQRSLFLDPEDCDKGRDIIYFYRKYLVDMSQKKLALNCFLSVYCMVRTVDSRDMDYALFIATKILINPYWGIHTLGMQYA